MTDSLGSRVATFAADVALISQVANGDSSTVVTTGSGPVRSVAKLIADNQAAIDAQNSIVAQLASGTLPDAGAPQDSDSVLMVRSAAAKQTTWSAVKAYVLSVFTNGSLSDAGALSGNEPLLIAGPTLKTTTSLRLAQLAVQAGYAGTFNFSPANLTRWRAALGGVRAGTRGAKILCLGDSTTAGAWSNGSWYGNALAKSYPKQLSGLLAAAGVPSNGEGCMGGHNWAAGNAGLTSYDPRLSLGTGWAINSSVPTLGCESLAITSGTGALGFKPSIPVDTFEIYYITNGGLGSFTTNFNGGATISTIASAGASGAAKAVVTGALGLNTLNIAPTGNGSVYIIGFVAYNSASPQVSVINAGWVGGIASQIGDMGSPWASANVIPTVAPDLTIIDCSINDWNGATPVATYQFYMQQAINQARLTGDVILMTGAPSNTAAATNGEMAAIVGANYGLALSNNIPLFDTVARWQSWAVSEPLGLYGAGEDVHPSGPGYSDIAQSVARQLLSV